MTDIPTPTQPDSVDSPAESASVAPRVIPNASAEASLTALANSHQRPAEEVSQLFEREFDRLKQHARIPLYVTVLALRSTRIRLLEAHRQTAG
jgi:hypothetical protein